MYFILSSTDSFQEDLETTQLQQLLLL